MASKKTIKKVSDKKKEESILDTKHRGFVIILILFSSISLYAVASFFNSTNDYIKYFYASTVESFDEEDVNEDLISFGDEEDGGITGEGEDDVVVDSDRVSVEIFSDMEESHVHAEAVGVLVSEGLMSGYGDGRFGPEDLINRAEILVVLTNVTDADFSGGGYDNCFSDVQDQWFSPFICYAKSVGWVGGFNDNSYKPARYVTKAEAVKIIFTALNVPGCENIEEKPYDDVSLDSWFAPYACTARLHGIISSESIFDPSHKVTRAEFAQIVYNVMKVRGLL